MILSLLKIQSILIICLFKLVGGHTFSSENTVLVLIEKSYMYVASFSCQYFDTLFTGERERNKYTR